MAVRGGSLREEQLHWIWKLRRRAWPCSGRGVSMRTRRRAEWDPGGLGQVTPCKMRSLVLSKL